ncbi:MAG TPA: hypothetical protein VGC42_15230, partial [Kofleriaceae bacterium]
MRSLLALLTLMITATSASAELVPNPLPLDEQAAAADLVCKATVLREQVVADPWFESAPGFEVREAELRVVSTIKGKAGATIRFRHFAKGPPAVGIMHVPATLDLVTGKTYLVMAMRDGAVYHQTIQRGALDILPAADAKPHHGKTLRAAAWHELTAALGGPDAVAALDWLDQLAGGDYRARTDFARADVIAAVRAHAADPDAATATAAITLLGNASPHLDDERAAYWLAGLPGAWIPGIGARAPAPALDPATIAALRAAATHGPDATRARAIRALGRAGAPAASIATWLRAGDPAIRAAAVAISAEAADRAPILAGLADPEPAVRTAAALAAG